MAKSYKKQVAEVQKAMEVHQNYINTLSDEALRIISDALYPKFKAYEGRYFRSTLDTKGEIFPFHLIKVVEVRKEDIYCAFHTKDMALCRFKGISIEMDEDLNINFRTKMSGYIHSLDADFEITEEEFNQCWNLCMDRLNKL